MFARLAAYASASICMMSSQWDAENIPMTRIRFLPPLFACMLSLRALAAEPMPCAESQPPSPLSLSAAIDFALCNQPQTRIAWAQVRAQEAVRAQADAAYLPSAALAAGAERSVSNGQSDTTRSASAKLAYTLFDFGQRDARLAAADATLSAAGYSRDVTVATIWLDTVQRYFNIGRTQRLIEATRTAEEAARASLAAAEKRAQVGSATQLDVLQARASLAQATLTRVKAEGQLALDRGLLAQVLGISPTGLPALVPIPADLPLLPIPPSELQRILDEAMYARPEVRQAMASIDAAEANIRAARASGLPSVALAAGLNATRDDNGKRAGNSIGITLNVPLDINGATRAQVQQAQAQRDAQTASLELSRRAVESDAWQSYYTLSSALETVQAAILVERNARQAAEAALARYQAGVSSILDVLNAQSAEATASQQLAAARFDWLTARATLAWALGGTLPADPLSWPPATLSQQAPPTPRP